jgi:hypothetical protein
MPRPHLLVAPLAALLLLVPAGVAGAQQAPNQPPAAAPDEATVPASQAVTVPVLANDSDDGIGRPEGEAPRLEVVGVAGDPRATYSPTDVTVATGPNDAGDVVVDYQVSDGELVSTGRLVVHVTPSIGPRLTIRVDKRVVALRKHTVTGRLSPAAAGVVVKVQRKTGGKWRTQAKAPTDGTGAYAAAWSTDRPGRTRLRAKAVLPDGRNVVSGNVKRTVRALAAPSISGPLSASDVPHSYRAGCPVGPTRLRMLRINHWGYDGRIKRGAIVLRNGEVRAVTKVLKAAFAREFPIRKMRPTDHFYAGGRRTPSASDKAAMRAGNTSAFNCRPVTGNPYRVSQHSYGNAVDINTIENPYVTRSRVYPAGSRRYLDRSPYRRGMVVEGGVVHKRFRALGWAWGGRWGHPDYQHFSSNGG